MELVAPAWLGRSAGRLAAVCGAGGNVAAMEIGAVAVRPSGSAEGALAHVVLTRLSSHVAADVDTATTLGCNCPQGLAEHAEASIGFGSTVFAR